MPIPQEIINGQNALSENKPRLDDLLYSARQTGQMLSNIDDKLTLIYFKAASGQDYSEELLSLKGMLFYIKSQLQTTLSLSISEVSNNLSSSVSAIDAILDGWTPEPENPQE